MRFLRIQIKREKMNLLDLINDLIEELGAEKELIKELNEGI